MQNDFEYKYLTMLAKVKKNCGLNVITVFSQNVILYFIKEYYIINYNIDDLPNDLSNIINQMILKENFISLKNIITDDELSMIGAVVLDEIEKCINDKLI